MAIVQVCRNQGFQLSLPPRKDLVNVAVQIFIMQCMVHVWREFGKAIRAQAVESTKRHRVCVQRRSDIRRQDAVATTTARLERVSRANHSMASSGYIRPNLQLPSSQYLWALVLASTPA